MLLDLTDDEAAAPLREHDGLIDADHYFLSPRVHASSQSRLAIFRLRTRAAIATRSAAQYLTRRCSNQRWHISTVSHTSISAHRMSCGHRSSKSSNQLPLSSWL